MFERNRVDNSLQITTIPAEVVLSSGEMLKGRFIINSSRTVYEVLNGDTSFLDFETHAGERSLIAKSTLASIRLVSVPGVGNLKARLRDGEAFDPHAILGVAHGAAWDEIRHAYLMLSKTYHPDRFAGLELPAEVGDYLAGMARRINAAYTALEAPLLASKRADAVRTKPIYTSSQRA